MNSGEFWSLVEGSRPSPETNSKERFHRWQNIAHTGILLHFVIVGVAVLLYSLLTRPAAPGLAGAIVWILSVVWTIVSLCLYVLSFIMLVTTVLFLVSLARSRPRSWLSAFQRMQALQERTDNGVRRRAVRVALRLICLLVAWQLLDATFLVPIIVTYAMFGLVSFIAYGSPPTILFLSSSRPQALYLAEELHHIVRPLSVLSLLRADLADSRGILSLSTSYTCLRTVSDEHWQDTVTQLIDLAAFVVIDIRELTPSVSVEVRMMLEPRRNHKALFLVDDGGASLEQALVGGILQPLHRERCITEGQLFGLFHRLDTKAGYQWLASQHDRFDEPG